MRKRVILAFCAVGALLPSAVWGQEVSWSYWVNTGGWLGISVDFALITSGSATETFGVITNVVEGSPAEEAGILVGDTITHLDGRPVSQKVFADLRETMEVGDLVRITVKRERQSREILVEAGERPSGTIVIGPDAERMKVEFQALSGNIIKNLDSVRLSIEGLRLDEGTGDVSLHILRSPSRGEEEDGVGFNFRFFEPFLDSLTSKWARVEPVPEFTVPFEALVVESRATAPIKVELAQVGKKLTAVRREELARQRELSAAIQGPIEEILRSDARTQELRAKEAQLLAEQEELAERLRQVSEEEIQRQWIEIRSRSEDAALRSQRARLEALSESRREQVEAEEERARDIYESSLGHYEYLESQFRSPIILGQSVMLGAQLAPLNPQLAEYFPVEQGVFVVQVADGTPAADSGLQGGDIIVRVAGEEVRSLSDLRYGLTTVKGPIQIRVIRKGDPVEILIRR